MTTPRRWLDDGAPPEIRRLLYAARSDLPPRTTVRRTVALAASVSAMGTAAGGAMGAVQAAGSSLGLAVAKWGAAAILGFGLAMTAATAVRHVSPSVVGVTARPLKSTDSRKSSVEAARSEPPNVPLDKPHPAIANSAGSAEVEAAASVKPPLQSLAIRIDADSRRTAGTTSIMERSQITGNAAPALDAPPRPRNSQAFADPAGDMQLQDELHLLDQARNALFNGQPHVAIHSLDRYRQSCPAQRLLPEALLIRMQAAARLGDASSAEQIAGEICARFPMSPHAARAKEFLQARSRQPREHAIEDNFE